MPVAPSVTVDTMGSRPLALSLGNLESPTACQQAGLRPGETGVTVTHVHQASPTRAILDVILSVDSHPVASYGTVELRPGERMCWDYYTQLHPIGEPVRILRLRDGVRSEVMVPLASRFEDFHPDGVPRGGMVGRSSLTLLPLPFATFSATRSGTCVASPDAKSRLHLLG